MARKGSLIGTMMAAKDQAAAETQAQAPSRAPIGRAAGPMITTAVHIPKAVHSLLRRVAVERANLHGGRPSVSAVLTDLVQRHRAELEREAHKSD
jgi:hypothetical protein